MWISSCSVYKQQVKCGGLVGTPTDTDYEEVSEMKHWVKGLRKIYLKRFCCSAMIFQNNLEGAPVILWIFLRGLSECETNFMCVCVLLLLSHAVPVQEGCHVGIVILVNSAPKRSSSASAGRVGHSSELLVSSQEVTGISAKPRLFGEFYVRLALCWNTCTQERGCSLEQCDLFQQVKYHLSSFSAGFGEQKLYINSRCDVRKCVYM